MHITMAHEISEGINIDSESKNQSETDGPPTKVTLIANKYDF